jgi:hypothetical protein
MEPILFHSSPYLSHVVAFCWLFLSALLDLVANTNRSCTIPPQL